MKGVHALAEECILIADDTEQDPQSRRVRIDTRLRLAGKWLPAIYGDRQQLDVSAKVEVGHPVDIRSLPPEAREQLLAQLLPLVGSGGQVIEGEIVGEEE